MAKPVTSVTVRPVTKIITRCVLCGREKEVHPEGCKPLWAKEREDTIYASSRFNK